MTTTTHPLLARPPHRREDNPGGLTEQQKAENSAHGQQMNAAIAAASDADLLDAYEQSAATSSFGVNYFVATEAERRGLRNRRTAELTAKGRRVLAARAA